MRNDRPLVLLGLALLTGCNGPRADEQRATQRGLAIALEAGGALRERLHAALADGGPAHAVDVCSQVAQGIMDSVSRAHGARIRRVSHRLRNPADAPDARDMAVLEDYLRRIHTGQAASELPARVSFTVDSVFFHQPIVIGSPLCLVCHGSEGQGLDTAAYAAIRERYPGDRATGHALGDLRGLWSIRWKR